MYYAPPVDVTLCNVRDRHAEQLIRMETVKVGFNIMFIYIYNMYAYIKSWGGMFIIIIIIRIHNVRNINGVYPPYKYRITTVIIIILYYIIYAV